jgi:chromosomal replication initiation ATPase DnaA
LNQRRDKVVSAITRLAIVTATAGCSNWPHSATVLQVIAHTIHSAVEESGGLLNRTGFHQALTKQAKTRDFL